MRRAPSGVGVRVAGRVKVFCLARRSESEISSRKRASHCCLCSCRAPRSFAIPFRSVLFVLPLNLFILLLLLLARKLCETLNVCQTNRRNSARYVPVCWCEWFVCLFLFVFVGSSHFCVSVLVWSWLFVLLAYSGFWTNAKSCAKTKERNRKKSLLQLSGANN